MSNFEVRGEDDAEVKKYTHDKNIVEILVEKESSMHLMEDHLHAMMERVLEFLKKGALLAPATHPKYVNQMTILNLQDEVRKRAEQGNYGADMMGAVF